VAQKSKTQPSNQKIILKNANQGRYFLLNLSISTRILSVSIKYFIHGPVCDVIKCCAWSCSIVK